MRHILKLPQGARSVKCSKFVSKALLRRSSGLNRQAVTKMAHLENSPFGK
nr:hypothetical protein [Thaumasiovibrio subtropicus]